MIRRFILLLTLTFLFSCNEKKSGSKINLEADSTAFTQTLNIIPISHASFILEAGTDVIYIDPTGGSTAYIGQKRPTAIFITDVHGDHLNTTTLEELKVKDIPVIAPPAAAQRIPSAIATNVIEVANGTTHHLHDNLFFSTIPMYNLRAEALNFHPKGRGNGYVINLKGERIYISGDTEDIPEMRALEDIDKAFVCMNLPYTMTVESAADAVVEFGPKQVYPYHYRGKNGLSDVNRFKTLVNQGNSDVEVIQLNWYK